MLMKLQAVGFAVGGKTCIMAGEFNLLSRLLFCGLKRERWELWCRRNRGNLHPGNGTMPMQALFILLFECHALWRGSCAACGMLL